MSKPIIGVLSNIKYNNDSCFTERIESYVFEKYISAIVKNGGLPIILHTFQDEDLMAQALEICDGLVFPGGTDVDPKLYGENPHKNLGSVYPSMDQVWYNCARFAIEKNIPTLGICRGMQMINVAAGGTLYQDIYDQVEDVFQHNQTLNRDNLMHRVHIVKDSELSKIIGVDCLFTNTIHHQAIKTVGIGFRDVAHTEDNIIEAIESEDGNIIAVQWHPEELLDQEERMNYLFRDLCKKCAKVEEYSL